MSRSRGFGSITLALVLGASAAVYAQRDFSKVEVKSERLAGNVHMLTGAGGNVGVCAGPDGMLLVDDQYAELSEKIRAALAKISDRPLRFVLNTHWHGDHSGGNENMAAAGALLLAHENVRKRMSTPQETPTFNRKVEASPAAALPVVTFTDTVSFHLNGEEIVAYHVARAHTDGDAVVFFRKANVVHMGDCFWNGNYPFIDVASGGSIGGMIEAVEAVLAQVGPQTKIIPGHGQLGDRAALAKFRDVLVGSRDRVRELATSGKSLAEIQAAKPTADWDADWGKAFIKPDKWIEFVYAGVQAQ
jgi:glyoxylase-like metal-dependent hydrolase (beta-lactamase superfamily II)